MGSYGAKELRLIEILKEQEQRRKENQMSTKTNQPPSTKIFIDQIETGLWDAELKEIINASFVRGKEIGLISTSKPKVEETKVEQLLPPVTPKQGRTKAHAPYSMKGNKRVTVIGEPIMLKGKVPHTTATYDEKTHFAWGGHTYFKSDVRNKAMVLTSAYTPAYLKGKKVLCMGISKKMQVVMLEAPNDPAYNDSFNKQSPVYITINSISNFLEI